MAPSLLSSTAAGALFGSALLLSGVYSPWIILSQMRLSNFHMLQAFLAASGCSAYVGSYLLIKEIHFPFLSSLTSLTSCSLALYKTLEIIVLTSLAPNSIALHLFKPSSAARPSSARTNVTRPPPPFLFTHEANMLGGTLLGAGMSLTGACPGTVLVQIATGVPSGWFAFGGAVAGGVLCAGFRGVVRRTLYEVADSDSNSASRGRGSGSGSGSGSASRSRSRTARVIKPDPSQDHGPKTGYVYLYEYLGVGEQRMVLLYEGFLALVLALTRFTPGARADGVLFPPVVGGLVIGLGQVASLVLTGKAIGVSSAYEQVGDILLLALGYVAERKKGEKQKEKEKEVQSRLAANEYNSLAFAVGIVAGSWTLSRALDLEIPGGEVLLSAKRAVLGGFVMVLGARIAGGCTSGHGISGMARFATASIISVAAMFTGGIALALCL